MSHWKKLLYLKQPFPDNYTDESFLDQLKRNTTVAKYSRRKVLHDFSLIAFYASLLLLVNMNFTGIYNHRWHAQSPTVVASFFLAVGFALLPTETEQIKLYFVISLLLLVLSPVLRSLTELTSLDSIWALLTILSCINVACHDYALDTSSYSAILLTNLSFFNGIVLASRLPLSMSVFCFLVFCTEVSILVPLFDYRLRRKLELAHFVLVAGVWTLVSWQVHVIYGGVFVALYWLGLVFVLVCLPLYFLFLQRYKNELQGPWDIAKPILRCSVETS